MVNIIDTQTLQFYADNAVNVAEKYDSCTGGIADYFYDSFKTDMKILDVGCGSGRDLRILHEMKYQADGVDSCEAFVEIANKSNTQYGSTVLQDELPELEKVEDKSYEGILCSAVLMHLPEEELFDASFAIRRILKEKGRLLLSIPLHDETINRQTKRDSDDRLFNGIPPEQLHLLFERIGFKLVTRWNTKDSLNRNHRKWATMLFELESSVLLF